MQPQATTGQSASRNLADGEWHRLHPATPLLRGGLVFVAIAGFVIANLRERIVELFLPGDLDWENGSYDPLTYIVENGILGLALLILLGVLLVVIGAFFLSWRMHTFRITGEAVEVRSGILFRTHRQAKLDRVQGVTIARPFLSRLVGAAKMEVGVAGQDSSVKLEYLFSRDADRLRVDVLTLASGVRLADAGIAPAPTVGPDGVTLPPEAQRATSGDQSVSTLINERVHDFLSPELDPSAAPPESVVRIPPGRLIVSTLVGMPSVFVLAMTAGLIVSLVNGLVWSLFWFVPGIIGIGSYYVSTVTKSLRYSIAGTSSGVRVGFGLLSTSNDTIPPGRVHAVRISQPILWRFFGWWQIKINKAGLSAEAVAGGKGNTTVLPVGTVDDVARVLDLLLEGVRSDDLLTELEQVLLTPQSSGFTLAPRRAAWVDPIAWKRTGFTLRGGLLLFRRGVLWRRLDLVPLARMQSIAVSRGPVQRMLGLSSAHAHTVVGPVTVRLDSLDSAVAADLFSRVAHLVVNAMAEDHSHRWAEERPGTEPEPQPELEPEPGTEPEPQHEPEPELELEPELAPELEAEAEPLRNPGTSSPEAGR
ncbi:PH domain-containing protein [Okibacterium endophyticum]